MIVDTHQHAFWHKRNAASLVADMDENGIDYAWLLAWESSHVEQPFLNDAFLNPTSRVMSGELTGLPLADQVSARDRYPTRFVLGYSPHPLIGDAAARFEAAVGMHGVRVCGEWKCSMLLDDPRCLRLFSVAGKLKCPVVVHFDVPFRRKAETEEFQYCREWYGGTIENFGRTLQACPDTIFLGHGPGFWREISGDAGREPELYPRGQIVPGGRLQQALDTYPNLWCDMSAGSCLYALRRDPAHARAFIIRYADRLCFARDNYGSETLDFLKTLDLPRAVQSKIFAENSQRLVAPPAGFKTRRRAMRGSGRAPAANRR